MSRRTSSGHWPALLYRLLLRAYPRSFRERYGADMEADVKELLAERLSQRGPVGLVSTWRVIVGDVVRSAPRERLHAWRRWAGGKRPGEAERHTREAGATMIAYELKQGSRVFFRAPGFALAAVLTAGLGIGGTAAIFSVLNAVVLRPLPFPDPEALVRIWEVTPQGQDFATSPPNVLDYRERTRAFESIGAFVGAQLALTGDGEPEQLTAMRVTSDVFGMLGGRPLLGRTFMVDEEGPGSGARVVVLSEGFWRRRFAGDPGVLGRTLTLNGVSWEVVGVMPESFGFRSFGDVWLPFPLDPGASRGDKRITAIGRLRAGVTLEQADVELREVAAELGRLHPAANEGWSVRIARFADWIIGPSLRRTMVVLLLAAGLLLLMACANVAHLLLVRAVARQREMGVRAALGASRGRIVAQLLAESLVLALFAGIVGVALAYASVPMLMSQSPPGLPRADEIAVSGTVLLFAAGVTVLTGLAFGLVPTLHVARGDLHASLRSGARVDQSGGRLREVLLVGELALATMLLVGAALLSTSFARLQSTETGFEPENVLAVPVSLTGRFYAGCPAEGGDCSREVGASRLLTFMTQAVERLEALPGVRRVGATNITPLSGGSTGMQIRAEGYTPSGASDAAWADWRAVTSGFFDAAGLPVMRGRGFTPAEEREGSPVAVVSESLARRYWPGEDAVGKRVAFGTSENWMTVVGVARDMRDTQLENDPRPVVFFPYAAASWQFMTLLIRTDAEPGAIARGVRATLWSIDPALPLPDVRPLDSYRSDAVAGSRFSMLLMTVFAAVALILGVLGVYGVTLFTVARRTREFGVRLALGAQRGAVLGLVLRGALRPVLLGVALGLLGAGLMSRLIAALLFGTEAVDAGVYASAGGLLAVVAFCASALPAWRATRVDPRQALAAE